MWYLHDGSPLDYAQPARAWISFRNYWIGRDDLILWPPRSPDLNTCDFFVWGYMKQLVSSKYHSVASSKRCSGNRQNRGILNRVQLSRARRLSKIHDETQKTLTIKSKYNRE
jgi:hypothetical protein